MVKKEGFMKASSIYWKKEGYESQTYLVKKTGDVKDNGKESKALWKLVVSIEEREKCESQKYLVKKTRNVKDNGEERRFYESL